MKILNLYAGIGGNRKLWGNEHNITAVEIDPDIAKIYSDYFPNDRMIIGDAHQFLIEHFEEFDFIWSSPPCQSHSRVRYALGVQAKSKKKTIPIYPDMKLWQEILFLQYHCKSLWVVENVIPYYPNIIRPTIRLRRHYVWSNFGIGQGVFTQWKKTDGIQKKKISQLEKDYGYNLQNYKIKNKLQILRNCVIPEMGQHILNCAMLQDENLFKNIGG